MTQRDDGRWTPKAGDWVVFDMDVGQIKEVREDGIAFFSDGHCETSGRLTDRFRPLTLINKVHAENFDAYYKSLREINGERGFNYPAGRATDGPWVWSGGQLLAARPHPESGGVSK